MATMAQEQAALQLTHPEFNSRPDSMLTLIERVMLSPDFDVQKLAQLLEVRERYEQIEARKAFVAAMNAFKRNPPAILKTKAVNFGNTHYNHATLDGVCDAVIGGLSAVAISHCWKVDQTPEWIRVTCILTHEDGHSEHTVMGAPPDNSGSKNSIQAIGSAITYLQRYTLMAAVGLAATEDTDGRPQGQQTPAGGTLGDEQYVALLDGIQNANSVEELKTLYLAAYAAADKVGDRKAKDAFVKAKNERYRKVANAS